MDCMKRVISYRSYDCMTSGRTSQPPEQHDIVKMVVDDIGYNTWRRSFICRVESLISIPWAEVPCPKISRTRCSLQRASSAACSFSVQRYLSRRSFRGTTRMFPAPNMIRSCWIRYLLEYLVSYDRSKRSWPFL